MLLDDDIGLFFDTDDFAVRCMRLCSNASPQEFVSILSEIDQDAMDGYVVGTVRELRYPADSVELLEGDLVQCGQVTYRVSREGWRVTDGRECVAILSLCGGQT